jgi:hypothetical protein
MTPNDVLGMEGLTHSLAHKSRRGIQGTNSHKHQQLNERKMQIGARQHTHTVPGSDKDVACERIHTHATRKPELAISSTVAPKLGEKGTTHTVKQLDTMTITVSNNNHSIQCIQCNTVRVIELSFVGTIAPKGKEMLAIEGEYLNVMVVVVRYNDPSFLLIHSNTRRAVELARLVPPASKFEGEGSLAIKHLDSVIFSVSNHNLPTLLHHTHILRVAELSIVDTWSASNGEESGSYLARHHHTMVPRISNDDISCLLVNTQTKRSVELSISTAFRSKFSDKVALQIELLNSMIVTIGNIKEAGSLVNIDSPRSIELSLLTSLAAEFEGKLNQLCPL